MDKYHAREYFYRDKRGGKDWKTEKYIVRNFSLHLSRLHLPHTATSTRKPDKDTIAHQIVHFLHALAHRTLIIRAAFLPRARDLLRKISATCGPAYGHGKGEYDDDSRNGHFDACSTICDLSTTHDFVEGGSVAGCDHSESRDLLGQSTRRQKPRLCWERSMNTAIGACTETGMAGCIVIIIVRIPAMAHRLHV